MTPTLPALIEEVGPRRDSVSRMRKIDDLPPDWRQLAHELGYGVFYAWLRGWSIEDVRSKSRDGVFTIRAHGMMVNGHGLVPRRKALAALRAYAGKEGL